MACEEVMVQGESLLPRADEDVECGREVEPVFLLVLLRSMSESYDRTSLVLLVAYS